MFSSFFDPTPFGQIAQGVATLVLLATLHHRRQRHRSNARSNATLPSYISEGNAHVVFHYDSHHVLRVPKTFRPRTTASLAQRITQHLWSQLLGEQYVLVPQPHVLRSPALGALNAVLVALEKQHKRPPQRLGQFLQGDALNSTTGELLLNALCLPPFWEHPWPEQAPPPPPPLLPPPCWSIEIKPKAGCLPSAPHILANSPKHWYSRYHMHQHYKVKQHAIQEISLYSPLDFFAKDVNRVKKALGHLWDHPQNNFKLFRNGQRQSIVPGHNKKGMLLQVTAAVLMQEHQVRSNVLGVQQRDVLDFEKEYWASWLKRNGGTGVEAATPKGIYRCHMDGETMNDVQNFVLARTAMDCSLVLSFSPLDHSDGVGKRAVVGRTQTKERGGVVHVKDEETNEGLWYQYRVVVVDLDLKPMGKLKKWVELDERIVAHFYKTEHGCRECRGVRKDL